MSSNPCSICEHWTAGVTCDIESKCPVGKMKAENKRLKKKIKDMKEEQRSLEGYRLENRNWGRIYEMGEC